MTIKAWWRSSTAGLCQQIVLLSAALLAILIAVSNAHAATYTWTGSGAGSGSIWDTASNWGGVLPSATGDLAEFNGANGSYLGGPLTLSYSTGGFAGGAGNAGLSIYLAANQTAPVQINANTTASCRLNNITLDPGAGAFTLGSGVRAQLRRHVGRRRPERGHSPTIRPTPSPSTPGSFSAAAAPVPKRSCRPERATLLSIIRLRLPTAQCSRSRQTQLES